MPTYEYECQRCGHHFELFQSMTEEPRKRCPECRGKVKRLLGTGAGILFKGSGFYATDYRSNSYEQGHTAEKNQKAAVKSSNKAEKKDNKSVKKKKEQAA